MARKTASPRYRGRRPATPGAAARQLERFYEIGRESLDEQPDRFGHGEAQKAAARVGLTPDMLGKARLFAHPKRGYTPHRFEQLLKTCREGPHPITRQHIIRLLSVPRGRRRELEQQIATEGWGSVRLGEEVKLIRREGRKPPGHGRPFRTPPNRDELVLEIQSRAERWKRWVKSLSRPSTDGEKAPIDQLPPALREELENTGDQLQRLFKRAKANAKRRSRGHRGG